MLLTVAFAVSFTTALQRLYLRAWRRPPGGGLRNKGRGAIWVAGVSVLLIILSAARSVLPGSTGPVLTWMLGVAGTSALWWWTAQLMLRGEVRWRALLPTAVLTGVGSSLYTMASSVWMPARVANDFAQFGTFGIALSFVTWLTGLCFLLVGAAVLGPAFTDGARCGGPLAPVRPAHRPATVGRSRAARSGPAGPVVRRLRPRLGRLRRAPGPTTDQPARGGDLAHRHVISEPDQPGPVGCSDATPPSPDSPAARSKVPETIPAAPAGQGLVPSAALPRSAHRREVSRPTGFCPLVAMKPAHWWP